MQNIVHAGILDLRLPETEPLFRVTDFKQWVYCPRILYYQYCLPDVRPVTYKMEAGVEAGRREEQREIRRSLQRYNLEDGRREFDVPVSSLKLDLRGKVDMVIWIESSPKAEVIPIDYKLSRTMAKHFQLQLLAYGLMLEESSGIPSLRGFLYSIPERRAYEIKFTSRMRSQLRGMIETMREMIQSESMPSPTRQRGKCVNCEFRRFCNDVL